MTIARDRVFDLANLALAAVLCLVTFVGPPLVGVPRSFDGVFPLLAASIVVLVASPWSRAQHWLLSIDGVVAVYSVLSLVGAAVTTDSPNRTASLPWLVTMATAAGATVLVARLRRHGTTAL